MWAFLLHTDVVDGPGVGGDRDRTAGRVKAATVWSDYRQRGQLRWRAARVAPQTLLYLALGYLAMQLLGTPHVPYRGLLAQQVDRWVLLPSVVLAVALTFFVIDATLLCERFTRQVGGTGMTWSDAARRRMAELLGIPSEHSSDVDDYLDLQAITSRTVLVGRFIQWPFLVLLVLIASRSSYFDRWDWPLSLVVIFAGMLAHAWLCALSLRRTARVAKDEAVARLKRPRSMHLDSGNGQGDGPEPRVQRIGAMIDELGSLRLGAFAPLSQHPLVRAILIPSTGVGLFALLEELSVSGL